MLKSTNNSFNFAIRKISSTEPVIADNPEVEMNKLIEFVKEYIPGANVSGETKITNTAGIKISDWRREYIILLTVTNRDMSEEGFDESLNGLAAEFERMHLGY